MIKNIFSAIGGSVSGGKTIRGFSPVELVIMVGFAALAAGALIYLGTTPHYTASTQPVNVNVKLQQSAAVATAPTRTPSTKADSNCDPSYVALNSDGGFDVTPASDVDLDAVNVQCAIDNATVGGTVVLKAGAFYFGDAEVDSSAPSGYKINYNADAAPLPPFYFSANHGNDQSVFITKSVKVIGERDSSGNHLSKIVGGYQPFAVGVNPRQNSYNFLNDSILLGPWDSIDTDTQPLDVAIKNLEFIDSFYTGITVGAATSIAIEGNRFTDMRGLDISLFSGQHHPLAYAIILTTATAFGTFVPANIGLTKGDINVINNFFDGHDRLGDQNDPWANIYDWGSFRGMTAAMRVMGISANLTFAKNKISNVAVIGVSSEDNLPLNDEGGSTLIANNTFDMGALSDNFGRNKYEIWGWEGNFCTDACHAAYGSANIAVGHTALVIKNNDIKVSSSTAYAALRLGGLTNIVVNKNNIEFLGDSLGRMGIVFEWGVLDGIFGQNKMTGKATAGVAMFDAKNNVFMGNNLSNLNASTNYYLDAASQDNIVIGGTGGEDKVVDEGSNNQLTGVTPMTGSGIGQQVSAAKHTEKSLVDMVKAYFVAHPEHKPAR